MSTTSNNNNPAAVEEEIPKPNAALLKSQYTYEDPPEEEEETKPLITSLSSVSADPWSVAMTDITLENIKKLATMDSYTIAGANYRRKMITPKARRELDSLQQKINRESNMEKKDELTAQQAMLCLEGFTKDAFDNCDIGYLEQIIGACIAAGKGFRKI